MVLTTNLDLVIVGGCGHVGLPLALAFAAAGRTVGIYDINAAAVDRVQQGEMPFHEKDAAGLLRHHRDKLEITTDPEIIGRTADVIVVVGTEVDEFLNPTLRTLDRALSQVQGRLRAGALLVLRSTVFPGTTRRLAKDVCVAYCPERSVQGLALEGILGLPQIIGADSAEAASRAMALFAPLLVETVLTSTLEAELAKLYTNAWRYTWFAIGNEFYEMSQRAGVDHRRVLDIVRHNYPRAANLPGPGFTAGPCLMKDTMQLEAFDGNFTMGRAAQRVNEGLPDHMVRMLVKEHGSLEGKRVALFGMAFKQESDDVRDSLSYKLKRLLWFAGAEVFCTDPYVDGPDVERYYEPWLSVPATDERADIVIICVPHPEYRGLRLPPVCQLIDPWGIVHG